MHSAASAGSTESRQVKGGESQVAGVRPQNRKRKLKDVVTDAGSAANLLEDEVDEDQKMLQQADSKRLQN